MAAQDPTGKHPREFPPFPPFDPPPRPVRVELDDGRCLKITPGILAVEKFRTGNKILTIRITADQARQVADALQEQDEYLEAVATRYRIRRRAALRRWMSEQ